MSSAEELKNQGNTALQAGHYEEAIGLYTAAIGLDASKAAYFLNRAQAFIKAEQYGAAIADAEAAMALERGNAKCYHRRGSALLGLSKYKEALADFRHVCELEPADRGARAKFGEVAALHKKLLFEQAIAFEHRVVGELLEQMVLEGELASFCDRAGRLAVDESASRQRVERRR